MAVHTIPVNVDPFVEIENTQTGSDIHNFAFTPIRTVVQRTGLSPISGSFDLDRCSELSVSESPFSFKSQVVATNVDGQTLDSSVTKLPLTETNLALFTCEQQCLEDNSINTYFGNVDAQDNISLEVNWDADNFQSDSCSMNQTKSTGHTAMTSTKPKKKKPSRSFSDPNLLEKGDQLEYSYALCKNCFCTFNESASIASSICPCTHTNTPFYPSSNPLSFFSSPPTRTAASPRSCMHRVTDPASSADYSESGIGSGSTKRQRHSIAGQMNYFKMIGFSCGGPLVYKKLTGGSSNSLFSTAVISGSSSAPNLRDMIPSTASASGNYFSCTHSLSAY